MTKEIVFVLSFVLLIGSELMAQNSISPKKNGSMIIRKERIYDVIISIDSKDFAYTLVDTSIIFYGTSFRGEFKVLKLSGTTSLYLYLFKEKKYFEMKQNVKNMTPLKAIIDTKIIERLKQEGRQVKMEVSYLSKAREMLDDF